MDPGRRGRAGARSSGDPSCPEAEEELLLPVKNALPSRAVATAEAEGQGPGRQPGARHTGWVHGAGALGVEVSPAGPGRPGSLAFAASSLSGEQPRGETRGSLPTIPTSHVSPLGSAPDSA